MPDIVDTHVRSAADLGAATSARGTVVMSFHAGKVFFAASWGNTKANARAANRVMSDLKRAVEMGMIVVPGRLLRGKADDNTPSDNGKGFPE